MKLINRHIHKLKELCGEYHVDELYVFGSVAKGDNTDSSDVDLLVKFGNVNPLNYFDNYINFKEKLTKLFLKNVDLIEVQTLNNPILIRAINRDKILIYGGGGSKMAV